MRHSFITAIFWLVLISSAYASVVEIPVTPTNLDTQSYVFAVVAKPTGSNMVFQVTITSKKDDIFADSVASVDIVSRQQLHDGGLTISSEGMKPAVQVTLKKEARVWTADFTVPRDSLKNPNLYFEYGEFAHTKVNGKITPMPSLICYQMKLRDFAKPVDKGK